MAHADIPQSAVAEVATRSQSSASPTFAHTSVATAYKDEQYCMDHKSRIPQPNTGETQFESLPSICVRGLFSNNSIYSAVCSFSHPFHLSMRAVHKSELAIGKTKGVSLMLEELKNCSDPKRCFDPNVFLKSLRLDSLLFRIEVDMCFYITNRAQLEQMYPYLPWQQGMVADVVYSSLKHVVSKDEEARAVTDKSK